MSSQYHGKYVLKTVRVLKKMIFIQCEHIINRHIPRGLLSEARLSYYKIPLSFDEDLNKTLPNCTLKLSLRMIFIKIS